MNWPTFVYNWQTNKAREEIKWIDESCKLINGVKWCQFLLSFEENKFLDKYWKVNEKSHRSNLLEEETTEHQSFSIFFFHLLFRPTRFSFRFSLLLVIAACTSYLTHSVLFVYSLSHNFRFCLFIFIKCVFTNRSFVHNAQHAKPSGNRHT